MNYGHRRAAILGALADLEFRSATEIASDIGAPYTAVAPPLFDLYCDGLLTRVGDARDGFAYRITLSGLGELLRLVAAYPDDPVFSLKRA